MGCVMGQVIAPTSPSTQKICTVPPGATVILSCIETSADVFLGTTSTVTSATGAPLEDASTTTISNPQSSLPFDVWCCAGTGTHPVGFILVTA